jgi:hypothetical protein
VEVWKDPTHTRAHHPWKNSNKKKKTGTLKCRLGCIRKLQQCSAGRDLPGHRHGKLFIGRPCKKRADDLIKLSRHQLKMVVAIHRTCSCEEAPVYYGLA